MRHWLAVAAALGLLGSSLAHAAPPTDRSAPTVLVTAPAASQMVAGIVTVTAVAKDDVGVVGVQLRLDGNALGAELTVAPYTVAWDTRKSVNGVHQLTAVARDAAGHRTTSAAVSIRVQNPAIPQGVFSLSPPFGSPPDDVLANPFVAGLSLRGQWPRVEASEGVYDWSYFDAELARATGAGKRVLLRVTSGGRNTPDWVFTGGVQTFSFVDPNTYDSDYGTTVTIPVFWDPVFLEKKRQLIQAMGQHFAGHPAIALVSASCANALTDDWNVPHSSADVDAWLALGYSSDKLIGACIQVVDAVMTAFPGTLVVMAVAPTSSALDPDPNYVATQVAAYARATYPGRFIVQKNSLSAVTPDPFGTAQLGNWQILVDSQPQTGGQMLWFVTDDATCRMNGQTTPCDPATVLAQAVTIGWHYNLQYQEIYQQDVRNPVLADVVRFAADALADPTVPANVAAIAVSATEVSVSWSASVDTVGVTGYRVVRNGVQLGITATPGYRDLGVSPSTTYTYRVSALDAAGNESPAAPATVTTPKKR